MQVIPSAVKITPTEANTSIGDHVAFPDGDAMDGLIWRVTRFWNGGVTLCAIEIKDFFVSIRKHDCSWLSLQPENSNCFFVTKQRRS